MSLHEKSTLFSDCTTYTRQCDMCQRIGRPTDSSAMPLTPILALASFEKWGIDFVGPINPPSRHGRHRYILVAQSGPKLRPLKLMTR